MTEPGGATEVGHIIAYLAFDKSEWNRQLAEIKADVASLARLSPTITVNTNSTTVIRQLADVRAAADLAGRRSPDIRVKTNAPEATFEMHLLRDSILALGPAAVPIAGVLGGALIGALPAAAALFLGIKGIQDEMKSGALESTQYGADIAGLKSEFTQLKTIAAGGILSGLDEGLTSSKPLFSAVNTEIGMMSGQLGSIIGHTGPAILSLFTQLSPLFNTIGADLDRGAAGLERFGASGHGVQSFVAFVQTELPIVEQDIGQLIVAVSHLTAGFVPFGNTALRTIGLVSQAISSIPIEDLQTLETTVLSGYVAWRTYSAITSVVIARNAAIAASAAKTALVQAASSAETVNASQQEALKVAQTKAAETEAIAATQRQLQVWGATYDAVAIQVADAAAAELAAAEAAAEGTSLAAARAAAAVRAAGVEAATGWSAMLGPAAAVVIGVGLLGATLLTGTEDTQKITQATNEYVQSLRDSKGAIDDNVRVSIAKALADAGLTAEGEKLHLTTNDLIDATLGQADAQAKVNAAVTAASAPFDKAINKHKELNDDQRAGAVSVAKFSDNLNIQSKAFSKAAIEAKAEADAIAAAKTKTDELSTTTREQAQILHVSTSAYQGALQAAQKNTQQAQAQTLAWQLENNAGELLQQTLDKLAGKKLSYAESENAFQQQLISQSKNLKDNKKGIDGLGESAVQNRADLLQLIQGAEQTADAYGTLTKSTAAGKSKLAELRQQIIDNAVAHGEDRKAVTAYVDSLLKIPKSVPPTKLDADKTAAAEKLAALRKQYDDLYRLEHTKGPLGINVETTAGRRELADLQAQIDALTGKTIPINFSVSGYIKGQAASGGALNSTIIRQLADSTYAAGGSVGDGWFTVGEQGYELGYKQGDKVQIFSNPQSQKMTGKSSVPGYASGSSDVMTATRPTPGFAAGTLPIAGPSALRITAASAPTATTARTGPLKLTGGRLELTRDSQGNLEAWIRDIVLDEADHAATIDRMH